MPYYTHAIPVNAAAPQLPFCGRCVTLRCMQRIGGGRIHTSGGVEFRMRPLELPPRSCEREAKPVSDVILSSVRGIRHHTEIICSGVVLRCVPLVSGLVITCLPVAWREDCGTYAMTCYRYGVCGTRGATYRTYM